MSDRRLPEPEARGREPEGKNRVETYEALPSGLVLRGRDESLATSSVALPEGAYTTFRTYGTRRVLRLHRHIERLNESVRLEGRSGILPLERASAAVTAALDATRWPESRVRLTFAPPRLFLAIEPFQPLPPSVYERGVACVTLALRRENPHAKDTRFVATARALYGRLPAGVEEALLVDRGEVLEGLSSNFFALLDGSLRTEEERVLLGVTRSIVLEVAEQRVPVERRAVRQDELAQVNEAFLTSVSREVLPVVQIDGRPVGGGRVGAATRQIMDAFAELVAREGETL